MNDDVLRSREQVSRRRALGLGGMVSLGGLLAACGGGGEGADTSGASPSAAPSTSAGGASGAVPPASTAAADDVVALLDQAGSCSLAREETQGPYWFDVDSIRRDVREDRPGTTLRLATRVQDVSGCAGGGAATPVSDAVVEIWHCDAGGEYSGFESGQGGPGGPGGGSGTTSDGSYSVGDEEAMPSDDGTYLRGAQVTNAAGIAQFTTVYPGWYQGRTVHIHLKVHLDKATVLTTQLYFDEDLNDTVFATAPYDDHAGRDVTNDTDMIFDASGLLTVRELDDGYLGVINLGVDA